ncbi:MAG: glycosyltransferase, partial [Deltaproteobacteria bacterium]|nr:glycosyltransferase [Deltaproteobacteria bacterium]
AVRAELGVGPAAPLVGMIACLKPQKDPLAFVEVARRIAERLPRARFVLAGDGRLRPAVEAAVARAGLGARLRLLGWRRDVPRLLRALDLFVLTSRWEGLPLTYLEAMATGVPIVGTAVDGAPEAVHHGEQGLLCRPGDLDAMAAGAVEILQTPALAREMAARGMARAREFDRWKMLGAHEALYLRLAGVS